MLPDQQVEWQRRIKAVDREYNAIRLACDRLLEQFHRDPLLLGNDPDLRERDIKNASAHLEGTYLIRLFAEFESGLRSYWSSARKKPPPGRTRDLLDGIAADCCIPNDTRDRAHDVRDYRNVLIHDREGDVAPIPISEARRHLCTFFARLPRFW